MLSNNVRSTLIECSIDISLYNLFACFNLIEISNNIPKEMKFIIVMIVEENCSINLQPVISTVSPTKNLSYELILANCY